MLYSSLDLPIPLAGNEILDVLDSTKLSRFQDCPRGYYFEYLLGWRPRDPNLHLGFGSAWHEAMEVLMKGRDGTKRGYTAAELYEAYEAFEAVFNKIFHTQDGDDSLLIVSSDQSIQADNAFGKTRDNAFVALRDYGRTWRNDSFRTLYTEVSGSVPISEDQLIHFKLDTIVEDDDGIWSYEHKTTGQKKRTWEEKWLIELQIGAYSHVLYTLYGDDAAGVQINGAVLRVPKKDGSSNNEFLRIPVSHPPGMMAMWLWEINHLKQQLDWNMQALEQVKPSDPIMAAFPRNPTSCGKYGCKFPGLCPIMANPVQCANHPPPGYVVQVWDPRKRGGDDDGPEVEKETPADAVVIKEDETIKLAGVPGAGL